MKKEAHLTNLQIAELSNVPLATVNRILSGQTENPAFDTVAAISKAMGGDIESLMGIKKVEEVETRGYDKLVEMYKQQMSLYEERIKSYKWIVKALFAMCALLLVLIFGYLVIDILNPHVGYIKY